MRKIQHIYNEMQYITKWFLVLAYISVLICTISRIASGQFIYSPLTKVQALVSANYQLDDIDSSVSPCELSTKSLVSISPEINRSVVDEFQCVISFTDIYPTVCGTTIFFYSTFSFSTSYSFTTL